MLLLLALSRIPILASPPTDSASAFSARIGHIGLVIITLVYILNTVWQTQQ